MRHAPWRSPGTCRYSMLQAAPLTRNRPDGRAQCTSLEHLNVSHNHLASLDSIPHLPRLRVLNCCGNSIPSGRGLANCPELEELWLASNSLASFADVAPLADATSLTAVVLHGNPVLRSARSAAAIRCATGRPTAASP